MAVLLVVVMFLLILLAEYLVGRAGQQVPVAVPVRPHLANQPRLIPGIVGGFAFADNVRYHPGHTWALSESPELVRIGMDDFAGRVIGRIDKLTLPKPGTWVRQGQPLIRVRRDERAATLASPIEGVVLKVNPQISNDPDLVRRDPYGDGWLLTVQAPDAKTSLRNLFGGALARSWLDEASRRLRTMMPTPMPALAQDGGLVVEDLGEQLTERWDDVTREFFLMD